MGSNVIPKKLYKKIHQLMPIICVDIIIINKKNEFLMLKRDNKPAKNQWWFPGGRIYKNELLAEAARRKVKEEIGLSTKSVKYTGLGETIFPDGPFKKNTHTINAVFLAKVTSMDPKIKLDSQSKQYGWFKKIDKNWPIYIKFFLRQVGFK